TSKMRTRLR
nr:immunoglobulin heavy chain junction region [Mus musculus]